MVSTAEVSIYRSSTSFVMGAVCAGAMFVTWVAGMAGAPKFEFITVWPFTLFILLFVLPVTVYLLYLSRCREPVIEVRDGQIAFTPVGRPWRTVRVPVSSIVAVRPDWWENTTRCSIVIVVTDECFRAVRGSKVWSRARSGELKFDLVNAGNNPRDVCNMLLRAIDHGQASLSAEPDM